jgi:RimJ/RimL family protein N-acetyltransferase
MSLTDYERFFPATLVLETPRVQLRLLTIEDMPALNSIAGPPEIWKYFTKELNQPGELQAWIEAALQERKEEKRMPFVIIDKDSMTICGSTSLGNISFYDKRIEIGWTWLGKDSMGTGVNRHAKFVMLSYALEAMRFERVEIKTDMLNERARAALVHIGAREEGILRSHMQMPHGRRRDSVYYGIVKEDWETIKMLYFGELA